MYCDDYVYKLSEGAICKVPTGFLELLKKETPEGTKVLKAKEILGTQYMDIIYESIKYKVILRKNDAISFAFFNLQQKTWYALPFFRHKFTFNNDCVDAFSFNDFHKKVYRKLKSQILL